MTLRHIRIFLEVCEQDCHVTRAAEALHMTQPAVTLAIREMEGYYGVKLFERIGRRLRITEAGVRLRESGGHIIELFDRMEKGLRNWDALGVLRVGASLTIGSQLMPGYVKAFRQQYPDMEVQVTVATSSQLEQKILDNTLDFALMEGVVHTPSIVAEAYMEDRLAVLCPTDGPFRPGQVLSQEVFRAQPLLLREHGSGTRETFERAVGQAGFSVTPTWEAMSNRALLNAVIGGLGICVLSARIAAGDVARGRVVEVTVEGLDFTRHFRIIHHRDKFLTPAARDFMDLCRRYESEHPEEAWEGH